jgi:hypothetical protein
MSKEQRRVILAAFGCMNDDELTALAAGLAAEDSPLVASRTAVPVVLRRDGTRDADVPLTGACLACYGAWKAGRVRTVAQAEDYFADLHLRLAVATGDCCAIRHLANWWDDHEDRAAAKREALALVREAMAKRGAA